MSEVIAEALEVLLTRTGHRVCADPARWASDSDINFVIFSYKRDFALLWGLESADDLSDVLRWLAGGRNGRELTCIVVWDEVPDHEVVAVSRDVTPYDWAAALSLLLYTETPASECPIKLRFLILNTPTAARTGFVQESLFAIHNVLPWIHGYEVVASGEESWAEVALAGLDDGALAFLRQAVPGQRQDAELLLHDIQEPTRVLTTHGDDDDLAFRAHGIAIVREAWKQQFLKPGNRHAVANLVGPLLVDPGRGPKIRKLYLDLVRGHSACRGALVQILVQLNLLVPPREEPAVLETRDPFAGVKGVNVLLLDDQYHLGFHHALAFAIFGESYTGTANADEGSAWAFRVAEKVLSCRSDPMGFLDELLTQSGKVKGWHRPRRVGSADVLLLDLRFWEDGDARGRARHMEAVLRACDALGGNTLEDPAFGCAYDAARAIANGETENELNALPLLALLVSHFDPSLPVVLFSSTHQRDVIKLVEHRPGIVTCFAKPLLSGYGPGVVAEAPSAGLFAAMRTSAALLEMRSVWVRIVDVDWCSDPIRVHVAGAEVTFFPRVVGQELRNELSQLYQQYLLGENFFDCVSALYEFLERTLVADGPYLWDTGPKRNRPLTVLRHLRNAKVHGDTRPPHPAQREKWRAASVLQFHALLDFIEGARHKVEGELLARLQNRGGGRGGGRLEEVQRMFAHSVVMSRETETGVSASKATLDLILAKPLV